MSITWSSIDVTIPPMDTKIILKKPNGDIAIRVMDSNGSSHEWAVDWLISENFTKWSDTE